MAKIGTAQIEIKPVLNDEALDALCARVEQRVREAVARGMQAPHPPFLGPPSYPNYIVSGTTTAGSVTYNTTSPTTDDPDAGTS